MHRSWKLAFAVALTLLATLAVPAGEARACGGCFVPPVENTQVAYHRMVLSISTTQSTLWDEIKYSGNPSSFAWVLPIKGQVTVGLSSDLLFAELDQISAVTVLPPQVACNCPACAACDDGDIATDTGTDTGTSGGVTVLSQMVVGPYETVQLSSTDPNALTNWLSMHGYSIPSDIAPLIAAYVSEGFDFLALKLVPGAGVDAMEPVRVTTPGASISLPLRMVAAGAGATLPITLFVVGEGRYEPTNFPKLSVDPASLVWDFDSHSSNYTTLEEQAIAASNGKGWVTESTQPTDMYQVENDIDYTVQFNPTDSGYGDGSFSGATMAEQADFQALFQGVAPGSFWLTRLHAELPRGALSTDLFVGASQDQSAVSNIIQATKYTGQPPCDCGCPCGATSDGGAGSPSGSSCAMATGRGAISAAVGFLLALVLNVKRRRGRS